MYIYNYIIIIYIYIIIYYIIYIIIIIISIIVIIPFHSIEPMKIPLKSHENPRYPQLASLSKVSSASRCTGIPLQAPCSESMIQ